MTPPRLIQLKCPRCSDTHWIIDSDYRGIDGQFIDYSERVYLCPGCKHEGRRYVVLQKSPPEFLLQPHPMYPMRQREFDYWAEILCRYFPDHPAVSKLGDDFHPNTHVVLTKLRNYWLNIRYRTTAVARGALADIEDALHIDLTPEPGQSFRQRAVQTPLADIRTAEKVQIYSSHSHHPEDSKLVFDLEDHLRRRMDKWLKTMEKFAGETIESYSLAVSFCGNRVVTEGSGWYDEFEEGELRSSNLILLLISPHYLVSTPCRGQLKQLEELSKTGAVKVVPILLRAADWNPPAGWNFASIVPIAEWPRCEKAFDVVLESVLAAVPDEIRKRWVDDPGMTDRNLE